MGLCRRRIKKKAVLDAIQTCVQLEHIWHNNRNPNASFKKCVERIRVLLEVLLTIRCGCKPKKKPKK